MGASEIYSAVEALPDVMDSLVVEADLDGGGTELLLFVTLAPDADVSLPKNRVSQAI
ncbi:hypothetical protein BH10PSE1_BH10PSE1_07750 [soil metagenome]